MGVIINSYFLPDRYSVGYTTTLSHMTWIRSTVLGLYSHLWTSVAHFTLIAVRSRTQKKSVSATPAFKMGNILLQKWNKIIIGWSPLKNEESATKIAGKTVSKNHHSHIKISDFFKRSVGFLFIEISSSVSPESKSNSVTQFGR